MRVVKAVRATLITFAVLGGVWGTLGLIAVSKRDQVTSPAITVHAVSH